MRAVMNIRAWPVFLLLAIVSISSMAADWQTFSGARLVDGRVDDGDSFLVEAGGKSFRVRLYAVDCPETSTGSLEDARRVREQTRYFGLPDPKRTIHFGNKAGTFTEHALTKPFTVHTAFASAPGRSSGGRVYASITTADGNDLASLLVENGLARTYGVSRKTQGGVARDEVVSRLRDLENSAMLKRVGIWSESDPGRIAELRAKQRSEDRELREVQGQAEKLPPQRGRLDPNTAGAKELQSIKGIGSVLAARIIAGRPYGTVDDLLKVKGIGPKKLESIRPYLSQKSIGKFNPPPPLSAEGSLRSSGEPTGVPLAGEKGD